MKQGIAVGRVNPKKEGPGEAVCRSASLPVLPFPSPHTFPYSASLDGTSAGPAETLVQNTQMSCFLTMGTAYCQGPTADAVYH